MLKLNRYKHWIQALRRANLSLRQWLTLLTIPFTERRATRRTWRRRMSQCVRCPIYDPTKKTCMLCQCYMPVKAAFAEQQCAGEIDGVSSARGWEEAERFGRMVDHMKLMSGSGEHERRNISATEVVSLAREHAIARGRDGAQIINDQQKENDE